MGKKVVIVGGGIIGLCSAYYLHKEGHQVAVIDKSDITSGASFVNAGYLTPSHIISMAAPGMISMGLKYMFNSSSPFYMKPRLDADFLKWAWYFKKSSTYAKVARSMPIIKEINVLSRTLYHELYNSGDLGEFQLSKQGLLMVYQTNKAGDHEKQVAEKVKALGLEVDFLDKNQLKQTEPHIKIDALGGVHYRCDRHTTPTEVMEKLKLYLKGVGVVFYTNMEIDRIQAESKSVAVKNLQGRSFKADNLVIATGAWTPKLMKQLGVSIPMQAGKGYCIDIAPPTPISIPAILLEARMVVTPMKGFTRLAGTMEFSGINSVIRKERVKAIAAGAQRYYPELAIPDEALKKVKCGLRPVSPDGLPYIGGLKKHPNIYVATGHAMMGWSLGPITGKLIAQLISKKKTEMDISPFHPERKF